METLQNPTSLVNLIKQSERIAELVRELVENGRSMRYAPRFIDDHLTAPNLNDGGKNAKQGDNNAAEAHSLEVCKG